jgi:hypothetical protein
MSHSPDFIHPSLPVPGFEDNYELRFPIEDEGHPQIWSIGSQRYLMKSTLKVGYHMVGVSDRANKSQGAAGRKSEVKSKNTKLYVHRIVAQALIPNPEGHPHVDHINGDKLDNRVENLRWLSHSHNALNRKKETTGYHFIPKCPIRPWRASIRINRKERFIGQFATEAEARAAYVGASELMAPGVLQAS